MSMDSVERVYFFAIVMFVGIAILSAIAAAMSA